MATSIPTSAPINGALISSFGGCMGFFPYQGTNTPEDVDHIHWLDVRTWSMTQISIFDDTTDTSSFGGVDITKTAESFIVSADVLYNLQNCPDQLVTYGQLFGGTSVPASYGSGSSDSGSSGFNWNAGVRLSLLMGDESNYPTDSSLNDNDPHRWYAPRAVVSTRTPLINAADKRVVGYRLEMRGPRIFKLPGEMSLLTIYINHMKTRKFTF